MDKEQIRAEVYMEANILENLDANEHIIEGYASTFKPTRNNMVITKDEMVKALAGYLTNPVMLYNHDVNRPIGRVLSATIDDTGLRIKAKIEDEEVWNLIKKGLTRGLSVGGHGRLLEVGSDLYHVVDFDMWEISVTPTPADKGAYIDIIHYVAPVVNSPYDLSEEWDWDWKRDADAIIEKFGWQGLARACAYVEKDGDKLPEKKEAYKLPHHKIIDGKLTLVYGGVVAALRRLPQTDLSESERNAVEKHLRAHLDFLKNKKETKNFIENDLKSTDTESSNIEEVYENIEENVKENVAPISNTENIQQNIEQNDTIIEDNGGGDNHMEEVKKIDNKVDTNEREGLQMDVETIKSEIMQTVDQKISTFAEDLKAVKNFISALERETQEHGNTLTREVQADILRVTMGKVAGYNLAPKYPATKRIVAEFMESDDSKGGYLVLPEYEKVIDMKVVKNHPLLQKFPYQTVGSPKLIGFRMLNPTAPTDPVDKAVYIPYAQRWTIESTSIPEVQTPIFEQFSKDIRAMAGIFRISELLLEDVGNFYDLVGAIMNILSVSINNTLDKEIIDYLVGLDATALGSNLVSGTELPTLDDLRQWTKTMLYRGFGNLFWLMSDDVEQHYMTQKDANGLYLFGDAVNGVDNRIWNIPVVVDRHLPANSLYLISADDTFSIKRLTGFRIDQNRNSYNEFVSGFILYRFILRIDWDVAWNAGIMKFNKTA